MRLVAYRQEDVCLLRLRMTSAGLTRAGGRARVLYRAARCRRLWLLPRPSVVRWRTRKRLTRNAGPPRVFLLPLVARAPQGDCLGGALNRRPASPCKGLLCNWSGHSRPIGELTVSATSGHPNEQKIATPMTGYAAVRRSIHEFELRLRTLTCLAVSATEVNGCARSRRERERTPHSSPGTVQSVPKGSGRLFFDQFGVNLIAAQ